MAQDILITPKAATPTIAYTGNGGGAATITQKILSTSIMQFDSGVVLFEMDPVASTTSALNLETNALTVAGDAVATTFKGSFSGDGSNLTGVVAEWDGSHTGSATINGALNVTGPVTVDALTADSLTVTGNSTLAGVTSTGTFRVNGAAQVTGTLNVTGNTTLAAVTGTNMRANGTLTVTGNSTLAAVTATNTQINGTLDVTGISDLNQVSANALNVTGNTTLAGVTGTVLNVTGNTTLAGVTGTSLRVNGAAEVTGTLNVTGNSTLAAVTGTSLRVNGAAQVTGTLNVTGNSTLAAVTGTSLRVNGNTQLTGTLNVTGNSTLAAVTGTSLTVTAGNTTLANVTGSNLNLTGNADVDGNVSATYYYGDGSFLTNIAATTIDHGSLSGLTDDDHLLYITVSGTQARNTITANSGQAGLAIKPPAGAIAGQNLFTLETNAGVDVLNMTMDGNLSAAGDINILGDLKAASKSFLIDHPDPAKTGWKLQYTCLEGPENGVYTRGRSQSCCIDLPDYWPHLVHEDSLSVQITPFGSGQMTLKVSEIRDNKVIVEAGNLDDPIDFFYIVHATRKDIPALVIEHEPVEDGK